MELRGNAWVPLGGTGEGECGSADEWAAAGVAASGVPGNRGACGLLYLCAEVSAPRYGRPVVVLASRPLTRDELNVMAKGLGRIMSVAGVLAA